MENYLGTGTTLAYDTFNSTYHLSQMFKLLRVTIHGQEEEKWPMPPPAYTALRHGSMGQKEITSNHCTIIASNSLLVGQPIAAQS
jgi:hypothetical protein